MKGLENVMDRLRESKFLFTGEIQLKTEITKMEEALTWAPADRYIKYKHVCIKNTQAKLKDSNFPRKYGINYREETRELVESLY